MEKEPLYIFKFKGRIGTLIGVLISFLFLAYGIVALFIMKNFVLAVGVLLAVFAGFLFVMPSQITIRKGDMEISAKD
jgi:zinc transporter ZupT